MRFELDPQKSEVVWNASKVTGKHHGHVTMQSGWIDIDEHGLLSAAEVIMDMTTITDDDLSNKTLNKTLTDHLKSADFFDADSYPTSSLTVTNVRTSNQETTIGADVTIRGKKNTVEFGAQISKEGNGWRCKATLTFDRTLWDIKFRSGKFFSGLGDVLIHDQVTLDIDVVTK